ncbi:hypothetical protein M3Y99_01349000 [Aphelenchoides fujianensis]|nr:hypothetical protein M3Y99_01349000 [Aphelenchoides fujianensis]
MMLRLSIVFVGALATVASAHSYGRPPPSHGHSERYGGSGRPHGPEPYPGPPLYPQSYGRPPYGPPPPPQQQQQPPYPPPSGQYGRPLYPDGQMYPPGPPAPPAGYPPVYEPEPEYTTGAAESTTTAASTTSASTSVDPTASTTTGSTTTAGTTTTATSTTTPSTTTSAAANLTGSGEEGRVPPASVPAGGAPLAGDQPAANGTAPVTGGGKPATGDQPAGNGTEPSGTAGRVPPSGGDENDDGEDDPTGAQHNGTRLLGCRNFSPFALTCDARDPKTTLSLAIDCGVTVHPAIPVQLPLGVCRSNCTNQQRVFEYVFKGSLQPTPFLAAAETSIAVQCRDWTQFCACNSRVCCKVSKRDQLQSLNVIPNCAGSGCRAHFFINALPGAQAELTCSPIGGGGNSSTFGPVDIAALKFDGNDHARGLTSISCQGCGRIDVGSTCVGSN